MRFRPANISLINSRSKPPTPRKPHNKPCTDKYDRRSKEFLEFFFYRLTGPSISGWRRVFEAHQNIKKTRTAIVKKKLTKLVKLAKFLDS